MLGARMRQAAFMLVIAGVAFAPGAWLAAPARAGDTALRFERDGALLRSLSQSEMAGCGEKRVQVADPYYGRTKTFLAYPLACVLELGFGKPVTSLRGENFFLRALDGYIKPASGERLAEPGGWLAFADAEQKGAQKGTSWEPIDRRQVDPGPFYLVWSGPEQGDPHRYPWPYQLIAIEIAPFEARYPHTIPTGVPAGEPAWTGFAVFRAECVACHAINGEGGTIGPELNLPLSIVEYRPAEQIKRFVRDPAQFRYSSMPANRHLTDAQLDGLIAYFTAMQARKHDPRRALPAP